MTTLSRLAESVTGCCGGVEVTLGRGTAIMQGCERLLALAGRFSVRELARSGSGAGCSNECLSDR